MIAVTPDSRKLAMPDLARSGSFQNSGKTKAPTMLLEGQLRSPDSSSLGIRLAASHQQEPSCSKQNKVRDRMWRQTVV
jgi:hypothetical protein